MDRLIITLNDGTDIRDHIAQFWTGEEVGLNAALAPRGPQLLPLNNPRWTLPGPVVDGYIQNQELGKPEQVTEQVKSAPSVDVHWISHSQNTVTLTVNGNITARTIIRVFKPFPNPPILVAIQNRVYQLNSLVGLGAAIFNPILMPLGIYFARKPSSVPDGVTFFRQTMTADLHATAPSGRHYASNLNGGVRIDGVPTYPDDPNNPYTSNDGPRVNASLAFPAGGEAATQVWGWEAFSMYSMWQSTRANSIPVPLQKLDWSWSFDITFDAQGMWIPTPPATEAGSPTQADIPPNEPGIPLEGINWESLPEWTGDTNDKTWNYND